MDEAPLLWIWHKYTLACTFSDIKFLVLQTSLYLRGSGGFGGPSSSEKVIEPATIPTDRSPDAISEYQVDSDSNLDSNPNLAAMTLNESIEWVARSF